MESNCESISSSRLIRVPVIKSRIRSKKEVKLFNNSSRNERDKSKLLAWKKKPLDNWYKVVFQFEKKILKWLFTIFELQLLDPERIDINKWLKRMKEKKSIWYKQRRNEDNPLIMEDKDTGLIKMMTAWFGVN